MQTKSIPFFITNLTKKNTEPDPHLSGSDEEETSFPTPIHSSHYYARYYDN